MDEVQGMTRDDIIAMAREAGIFTGGHPMSPWSVYPSDLERFAALVAAHTLSNIDPSRFMSYQEGFEAGAAAEREACARVCEALVPFGPELTLQKATAEDCAIAIRARGETK